MKKILFLLFCAITMSVLAMDQREITLCDLGWVHRHESHWATSLHALLSNGDVLVAMVYQLNVDGKILKTVTYAFRMEALGSLPLPGEVHLNLLATKYQSQWGTH